jgi:hypothetical protein
LLAASSGNHDVFVVLVAFHVVSAVVGSGAIALSGVYGGSARHPERAGAIDEARRWFAAPNRLALLLLSVPFFGIGALLAGGRSGQFQRAWVIGALIIWVAMAGLLTGVVRPAEQRLRQLLAGGGSNLDNDAIARIARRCTLAAGGCDVGFLLALGLMIWQP